MARENIWECSHAEQSVIGFCGVVLQFIEQSNSTVGFGFFYYMLAIRVGLRHVCFAAIPPRMFGI